MNSEARQPAEGARGSRHRRAAARAHAGAGARRRRWRRGRHGRSIRSGVAADHGFQAGDVILDVSGKSVASPADVRRQIADARKERQAHTAVAGEVERRHTLRRASARQCLTVMGRSAGIRRPRRAGVPWGTGREARPRRYGSAPASVAPAGRSWSRGWRAALPPLSRTLRGDVSF